MVSEQPWPTSWAQTSAWCYQHLFAWGAVERLHSPVRWNAAPVISSSGESGERERRRGRGGRKKKKKGGCFLGRECAFEFVLVCLYSAHVTAGKVKNQIDCYHPCPSLFCPSLVCLCSLRCVLLPGLVSIRCGPQPCGVSLPTNQTSQCHWAASSKTHGHVSSLHSTAFQRLAGSSTKEL